MIVNGVEKLVKLYNVGVGESASTLRFTQNHDTVNHVTTDMLSESQDTIELDVLTLDDICRNEAPVLMKMDVEGFELSALKGARQLMLHPELHALIIEINGTCRRYGVSEDEIHDFIISNGFKACSYDPLERNVQFAGVRNSGGNTLYIKNEQFAAERVRSAPKFKVLWYNI